MSWISKTVKKRILIEYTSENGTKVEIYDDGTYLNALGISKWYIDDKGCMRYSHNPDTTLREDYFVWDFNEHKAKIMADKILEALIFEETK